MPDNSLLRALIVDDEPLAREIIRKMLGDDKEVEIIAEASNGVEAVAAINEHRPDIIFLDVQMPELDGFGVIEAVGAEIVPALVFVTAYDRYAVRAFEVFALDYLLKPFGKDRFEQALARAKQRVKSGTDENWQQKIFGLLDEIKSGPSHIRRLAVKTNGRVIFLKTEEIDYIEAEGNYVRLHAGKESYLYRETVSNLESQLDQREFLRIHRSAIVNIDRIQELRPWFQGEYRIVLRDGTQLPLSHNYREKLRRLLGKPL